MRGSGRSGSSQVQYLQQLFSLQDKVALVTGASRGLGLAMAEALLRAGASVTLSASNAQRLAAVTETLRHEGLKASAHACDLANGAQVTALAHEVLAEHGRIDVLVNAAGITLPHALEDYTDESWRQTFLVNVEAPFRLARELAPQMKSQRSGSIINVTSVAAELGFPDNPAYLAAKGALRQLTKSLAYDLGPFGVRVNNLGPGYFRTDMTTFGWSDPARREARAARTSLGRWGEPCDLAGVVIFLASNASRYVTAQDLYVDGGWLAKGL